MAHHPVLRFNAHGNEVKEMQTELDKRGYNLGPSGVDGWFGTITLKAVKDYQYDRWCNTPNPPYSDHPVPNPPPPYAPTCQPLARTWPLAVDGVVGFNTWSRLDPDEISEKLKSKGPLVKLCQSLLNFYGASPPLATDSDFGPLTTKAVKDFQTAKSITVDGIVGEETWRKLRS
jgi:peptidoglycan hydrolase-like protein with peptidoglycan-binding domain